MCDQWKDSFDQFVKDMGEKPTSSHSIDRIDVNGNYCPENCRWANPKEQARNKRNSKIMEFRGERLTMSAWSERLGITISAFRNRITMKWADEMLFTTPAQRKGPVPKRDRPEMTSYSVF